MSLAGTVVSLGGRQIISSRFKFDDQVHRSFCRSFAESKRRARAFFAAGFCGTSLECFGWSLIMGAPGIHGLIFNRLEFFPRLAACSHSLAPRWRDRWIRRGRAHSAALGDSTHCSTCIFIGNARGDCFCFLTLGRSSPPRFCAPPRTRDFGVCDGGRRPGILMRFMTLWHRRPGRQRKFPVVQGAVNPRARLDLRQQRVRPRDRRR